MRLFSLQIAVMLRPPPVDVDSARCFLLPWRLHAFISLTRQRTLFMLLYSARCRCRRSPDIRFHHTAKIDDTSDAVARMPPLALRCRYAPSIFDAIFF